MDKQWEFYANLSNKERVKAIREDKSVIEIKRQDETERDPWAVYDSSPDNFGMTFSRVLPKEFAGRFQEYVEANLAQKQGRAVGVELGGPGSNLFFGFKPGLFKKTLGVTLVDKRAPWDTWEDFKKHHQVLEGNMFSAQTRRDVRRWLGRGRIDFLIERMVQGLRYMPRDIAVLGKALDKWYRMLADEGIMFVEVYERDTKLAKDWAEFINQKYGKHLEVQLDEILHALRLKKLKGAPKKLPLINLKESRNAN